MSASGSRPRPPPCAPRSCTGWNVEITQCRCRCTGTHRDMTNREQNPVNARHAQAHMVSEQEEGRTRNRRRYGPMHARTNKTSGGSPRTDGRPAARTARRTLACPSGRPGDSAPSCRTGLWPADHEGKGVGLRKGGLRKTWLPTKEDQCIFRTALSARRPARFPCTGPNEAGSATDAKKHPN